MNLQQQKINDLNERNDNLIIKKSTSINLDQNKQSTKLTSSKLSI